MLIIAALIALFTTQSPANTEPATKAEPVAIEAPVKEMAKEVTKEMPKLVESN